MKKILTYASLAAIFMLNTASFCSRDDNNSQTIFQDTAPIVSGMSSGTWRVTFYSDHGNIKTDNFTGYNFTFGSGNVLTATNGSNTNTGAWSVTNTATGDDTPNDPIDFNIFFSAPPAFEDISDDWDIVSRTETRLEMRDDSSSGNTPDYITFEKN